MNKRLIAAQVTTKAVLSGNLDATKAPVGGYSGSAVGTASMDSLNDDVRADGTAGQDGIPDDGTSNFEPHFIVPLTIYDKLGNEYKLNVNFWKNFVDSEQTKHRGIIRLREPALSLKPKRKEAAPQGT